MRTSLKQWKAALSVQVLQMKLKMRSHSYKIVWRPLLRTTVKKENMLQERVPFGGTLNG